MDLTDNEILIEQLKEKYGYKWRVMHRAIREQFEIEESNIDSGYIDINETYSAGVMRLSDGSKVTISKEDALKLNKLFDELTPANRKKMKNVLMVDKSGYEEILSFAKEAD